jgi:hypothetical protein
VVLLTVVPTSFVGVDSFVKMRFRFIAVICSIFLWEAETGGKGGAVSFDHISYCLLLNSGNYGDCVIRW